MVKSTQYQEKLFYRKSAKSATKCFQVVIFFRKTHNEVFEREFQETQVLRVLDFDRTS